MARQGSGLEISLDKLIAELRLLLKGASDSMATCNLMPGLLAVALSATYKAIWISSAFQVEMSSRLVSPCVLFTQFMCLKDCLDDSSEFLNPFPLQPHICRHLNWLHKHGLQFLGTWRPLDQQLIFQT